MKDVNELAATIHEAFHVATTGRPGPVVVDIPKDVQFAKGIYTPPQTAPRTYLPPEGPGRPGEDQGRGRADGDGQEAGHLFGRRRHQFRARRASQLLRELVDLTGFPITSTLMGLGAYPASGKSWLGMLGMHGTYEANMAMHDCDVMALHRRALRRPHHRPHQRLLAELEEDPHRHRSVLDQQERARRRADHRRCRPRAAKTWSGCGGRPSRPTRRRCIPGGSRSPAGGARLVGLQAERRGDHAAICGAAALRGHEGPRHLHHHRGRPAPDVGGAALPFRPAEPLDDVRRAGHDGLRPAGGAGRPDRASGTHWSSTSPATPRCR